MVLKVLLADIVVLVIVLLILFVSGKSWLMTMMFNYIIEGHTVHDIMGHEQGATGDIS